MPFTHSAPRRRRRSGALALLSLVALVILWPGSCSIGRDRTDDHGMTALMRAARAGDAAEVERLVAGGADVDQQVPGYGLGALLAFLAWMQEVPSRDPDHTALMYGIGAESVPVVRTLIAAGADVALGPDDVDPLGYAMQRRNARELVPILLEAGATVAPRRAGGPPIPPRRLGHVAAAVRSGDTLLLRLVLERDADPNAHPRTTAPPLVQAVRQGDSAMVAMLLAAGADPAARDERGWTAAQWALEQGRPGVLAPLADDPTTRTAEADLALLEAVRAGDTAATRRALGDGASPAARSTSGDPALVTAIYTGDSVLVAMLLDAGASPRTSRFSRSVLLEAVQKRRPDLVGLLLERGAPATEPGIMVAAAGTGRLDIFRALEAAGGDPRTGDGAPLRSAASGGHVALIEYLLARGALVDAADQHHRTALGGAVARRHPGAVRALLDAGADPNRASPGSGWTPLMSAAMGDDTALVRLLLDAGADPGARDSDGRDAAEVAVRAGAEDVLPLLRR